MTRAPVLFIGETLVDLICERPVAGWAEADAFVPHCDDRWVHRITIDGGVRRARCATR